MGRVLETQRTYTALMTTMCRPDLLLKWRLCCPQLQQGIDIESILQNIWDFLTPAHSSLREDLSRPMWRVCNFLEACMYQWIVHARVLGMNSVIDPMHLFRTGQLSAQDFARKWGGLQHHANVAMRDEEWLVFPLILN